MQDLDLRICPFCGSKYMSIICKKGITQRHYHVLCMGCGATGAESYNEKGAARAWNRRV